MDHYDLAVIGAGQGGLPGTGETGDDAGDGIVNTDGRNASWWLSSLLGLVLLLSPLWGQ